jgi:hypothetical protein
MFSLVLALLIQLKRRIYGGETVATYELIEMDLWTELWWLMIVLPFIGAILTPIVAKVYNRLREILGIVSIGISAVLAAILIADVPDPGEQVHNIKLIPWSDCSWPWIPHCCLLC